MSKSKLSISLFVILFSIVGFFIGTLLSRFFIPKNVGLAGGAMVLGYGVLGLFIGLVGSLIIQRYMNSGQLRTMNILGGLFSLAMIGWITYKMKSQPKQEPIDYSQMPITKEPTAPAEATQPKLLAGPGMAKPHFEKNQNLNLYLTADDQSTPAATVVFENMDIASAPEWFLPEHLKLDYSMLFMKVKSRDKNMLEVEVNRDSKRTCWVKESEVSFMDWPTFYTNIFSVEAKNYADNPVREKPMTHAQPMQNVNEDDILSVIKKEGDWLQVRISDSQDYSEKGTGWIRWRSDGELLLDYNLLS